MPTKYRQGSYLFTRDSFDLGEFTPAASTEVGNDEFSTVERLDVEQGEAVEVGAGSSTNPLQAEASVSGDIQDGGNSDIDGRYRLAVLNAQNNVVDVITQGTIDAIEQTRSNSIDGDIVAFTGVEVYEPFQLGLQLKTASGTATYSSSNSSLSVDGFRGEDLG